MAAPASETLLQEWYRRVWNEGDLDAIEELFAADGLAHGIDGPPLRGPAAFREFCVAFRASFAALSVRLVHEVTERGLTAAWTEFSVTPKGGKPPIRFAAAGFVRAEGRRIVEAWNCCDFLPLLQGLGQASPAALTSALAVAAGGADPAA
jgi:hypothetical protein